jgi:hypothetical protein
MIRSVYTEISLRKGGEGEEGWLEGQPQPFFVRAIFSAFYPQNQLIHETLFFMIYCASVGLRGKRKKREQTPSF